MVVVDVVVVVVVAVALEELNCHRVVDEIEIVVVAVVGVVVVGDDVVLVDVAQKISVIN